MNDSLVTSVRVQTTPSHDMVTVVCGATAMGSFRVQRHQGERIAARLLCPIDPLPFPLVIVEAAGGDRTFQRAPTDGLEVFPAGAVVPAKPVPEDMPPPRIGR